MPRPTRLSDYPGQLHCASIYYDFEVDGGAVGGHSLPGAIPAGAIMMLFSFYEVLIKVTSTGYVRLAIKVADEFIDLKGSGDSADPSWNVGTHHTELVNLDTYFKLTEDTNLQFDISGQPVTAGKFVVHMFYVMSPDLIIDGLPASLVPLAP